jgi:single-strand DNA-binding protein
MAILSGLFRLARDAELRSLPDGTPVAQLALVYNYGTKKDERGFLPSQFIDVGLWGNRAEAAARHLLKGGQIFAVINDVHIETFRKSDGAPGVKLAGRLNDFEFANGPREAGQQQAAPRQAPAQQPSGYRASAPRPAPAQTARPAPASTGSGFDDMDDDIPF